MTGWQAIQGLRDQLEDQDDRHVPFQQKLRSINAAILDIAMALNPLYLTEIEYIQPAVAVAGGQVDITSLNKTFLRSGAGLRGVKSTASGGKNATIRTNVSRKELDDNSIKGATIYDPVAFVLENKIWVYPDTITEADITFLRVPDPILLSLTSNQADSGASTFKFDGLAGEGLSVDDNEYNGGVVYNIDKAAYFVITAYVGADLEFTVSPASGSIFAEGETFYFLTNVYSGPGLIPNLSSDLNSSLDEITLKLAEGLCWPMIKELERSGAALKLGFDMIEALNGE